LIISAGINLDKAVPGSHALGHSRLTGIDPRIKIISAVIIIVVIAILADPISYAILSLLLIAGMILSELPAGILWANFRPFLFLAIITFILHLVFSSSGGEILFTVLGREITRAGAATGAIFAWRIFLLFAVAVLFNLTTDPLDISDASVRLLRPLNTIGLRADHAALLIFMSFRFVPLISEEAQAIYAAQLSRGFNPRGGLVKRLKNSGPLLVAIFSAVIRRAGNMAVALDARGFHPARRRTSFRQFTVSSADILFLAVVLVFSTGSIIAGIYA
jgi:energy-coupling factor transport system permease protein